jgi:AAA domain
MTDPPLPSTTAGENLDPPGAAYWKAFGWEIMTNTYKDGSPALGCRLPANVIVLAANGEKMPAALTDVLKAMGVPPRLTVTTRQQQYVFFRLDGDCETSDFATMLPKSVGFFGGGEIVPLPLNNDFRPDSYVAKSIHDLSALSEVALQAVKHLKPVPPRFNPLLRYSLLDCVDELEAMAQDTKPLLGNICMMGQATMIYAPPNTGKTLLTIRLLIDAIQVGLIDGNDVIYMNADDSSSGLAEKAGILKEFGVHVVAPGFRDFKAKNLMGHVADMVARDSVHGIIIILDTTKKLVSLMDKRQSSEFADVVRQVVMKGGTVIGLGHTNKRPDANGRLLYSGTSDIVDDFDAAYLINSVSAQAEAGEKVVEFECIKRRGNNADSAAYAYAAETGITYAERLASVRQVDPANLDAFKRVAVEQSDADIIAIVSACITQGINQKMALSKAAAVNANISSRAAMKIIERYTGDDPVQHRWTFSVRERGSKVYALHPQTVAATPA